MQTIDGVRYLFDDVDDPYQLNNLAGTPEAAALQSSIEQKLKRELDRIDDPFREKEYYLEKWGYEVGKEGIVPYTN